jgi:AraC-like DNA-binding protein
VDRTPDAQYYVAVIKPGALRAACPGKRYAPLRRARPERDGVVRAALDAPGFDLMHRAMDAAMEGSPPPDLVNREAGYGAHSAFVYRHADPDGLNAALRFVVLLGWRLSARGGVSAPRAEIHPGVRRALAVLSDPSFDGGLGELGRACGVSPSHLSRLFGREIGVSLSRYRNSIRLGRFLDLFAASPRPTLLEAALGAGFGSYSRFHKVFVEAYGGHPRKLLSPES